MQVVYNAVLAQLKAKTSLAWIDLEAGQLEIAERPPLAFPAGLVDIQITGTEDLSNKTQLCHVRVRLRLAFDIYAETNADAPDDIRADAISYFDGVNEVYCALQGYSDTNLSNFTRKNMQPEKRSDGLKVVAIDFETSFRDYSAGTDELSGWS